MVSFVKAYGGDGSKGPPKEGTHAHAKMMEALEKQLRHAIFPKDCNEWPIKKYGQQPPHEIIIETEGFDAEAIKTSVISLLRETGVIRTPKTINDDQPIDGLYLHVFAFATTAWKTKFQITLGVSPYIYEAEGGLGDKLANPEMLKQLHDGPQPGFGGRG